MLEVGQILSDRYQLQTQVGRNAGRQTWLAIDQQHPNQEKVIIKLLTFGGDVQWQDLKLFEREAQTLKQLDHPYIPRYRDYFAIDDRSLWFGLVQDYIPGTSLKNLLDQGTHFSELEIRAIATQILQILIYLHHLTPPILHRDIKPSNLIQAPNGKIYLVDFGAVQDKAIAEGSTLTVVGTYGYCPLEQFGGKACPASDLYALGATLIHLLTGVAPAELPTENLQLQFRHLVNIDDALANWLERLVEPAVEKRPAIAQEALDLLNRRVVSSTPQGKIRIRQPWDSPIVLHREPHRLEITMPPRKLRSAKDYGHLAVVVGSSCAFLVLFLVDTSLTMSLFLLWVVLGAVVWRSVEHIFGETQIHFDRNLFTITKNIWIIQSYMSKGVTSKIQDISLSHPSTGSWHSSSYRPQSIIMTCQSLFHAKKYERRSFGDGLSEEELIWLAQEIRSWLFD